MTPELSTIELKNLHKEAMDLYKLYLKPTAAHRVLVSDDAVQEIHKSNNLTFLNQ